MSNRECWMLFIVNEPQTVRKKWTSSKCMSWSQTNSFAYKYSFTNILWTNISKSIATAWYIMMLYINCKIKWQINLPAINKIYWIIVSSSPKSLVSVTSNSVKELILSLFHFRRSQCDVTFDNNDLYRNTWQTV